MRWMSGTGNFRTRSVRAALLAWTAAALGVDCATTASELARDDWHELRTPRFVLWTNGEPERAQALAAELERFHLVLRRA